MIAIFLFIKITLSLKGATVDVIPISNDRKSFQELTDLALISRFSRKSVNASLLPILSAVKRIFPLKFEINLRSSLEGSLCKTLIIRLGTDFVSKFIFFLF